MDENKKVTKYFIKIVNEPIEENEFPEIDIDQFLEDHPELKKLGLSILLARKKIRH